MFPTTVSPAVAIDPVDGSGKSRSTAASRSTTFATFIRNTDPGSNAGIPGLALPAGMTPGGCRSASRSTGRWAPTGA